MNEPGHIGLATMRERAELIGDEAHGFAQGGQRVGDRRGAVDARPEDLLLVGRRPAVVADTRPREVDDRGDARDLHRVEHAGGRVPAHLVGRFGRTADEAHHLVTALSQECRQRAADQS